MKKILITSCIFLFALSAFCQTENKAKKPTIMVLPSDQWCIANGFFLTFNNQGTERKVADYRAAFQSDPTINQVLTSMASIMQDNGFQLETLEEVLNQIEMEAAEDAMRSSKTGGEVQSSPLDELKKVAKADIWMRLSYTVNGRGMRSIQFTLQGIDAATGKQIASATGNGEPSTGSVAVLMEEAVYSHMDNFNAQLMSHFDDMFENGREIIVRIKVWDDWGEDLETEDYGDDELGILIEDWIAENTVNGVFNLTTATENQMLFKQVRIPLFSNKGRAYDARAFGKDLRKYLRKELLIECKAENDGVGKVTLFIGGK